MAPSLRVPERIGRSGGAIEAAVVANLPGPLKYRLGAPDEAKGDSAEEFWQPMDKRKDPRFKTRFDALYASGRAEGSGSLKDISYSGACLESVSLWPALGTEVRLYVFVQPIQPFELVGHVVRRTESGFAIEYDISDPEIQRLVDDVGAIVAAPD